MNTKQFVLIGLVLLSLVMLAPARAANLSTQTINGIQKNIKPAIPGNAAIKKTSPLSAAQVSRALPAQVRGVSQQAGVIRPAAKAPLKTGFATPALSAPKLPVQLRPILGTGRHALLKEQKGSASRSAIKQPHPVAGASKRKHSVAPVNNAFGQIGHTAKPVFNSVPPVQAEKNIHSAIAAPTTAKPGSSHGGFAPKIAPGRFGLNKPVTSTGGKSLLSPATTTGPRHVVHNDHAPRPRLGGFAPISGVNKNIVPSPLIGRDGRPLIPPAPRIILKVTVWKGNSATVLSEVNFGERVHVRATISNLGSVPIETIKLVSNRYGHSGFLTLGARGRGHDTISIDFDDVVTTAHTDADNQVWFRGGIGLQSVSSGGAVPHQNDPDSSKEMLPVRAPKLVVVDISNVFLGFDVVPLPHSVRSHLETGFDVKVGARVTVKNVGHFASFPMNIDTSLVAVRHANLLQGRDSGMTLVRTTGGDVNPNLSQPIPGLQAGESFTYMVSFTHLPHQLWDMDNYYKIFGVHHHNHAPLLAGAYACAHDSFYVDGHGVSPASPGTQARITARIALYGGGVSGFSMDGVVYRSSKIVTGRFGEVSGRGYSCALR